MHRRPSLATAVFILTVLVAAAMFVFGWLKFQTTPATSEVILDRAEINRDAEAARQKAAELFDRAARTLDSPTSPRDPTAPIVPETANRDDSLTR